MENGGVGKIIEEINKETAQKVSGIEATSSNKVNFILKHFEQLAEENAEKIRKQGDDEILVIKRQVISNAEIEAKGKIDKEKFNRIENVFEETRQVILNLSAQEKKEIIEKMCDVSDKENFVFYVDKKYANLVGNVNNVKEADINDFGVIIKSRDGKITTDNTLTNRLNILKQHKRYDVAKILFG
ncbi:putative archaeal A1AO-type ATP synthase, subunit E [groundwater metagenome]|uniref:Putative archaeal A1AO-type ATP synthase, subunit E n=1 Tax=groundwater metagenome TaxID=717931 RepID=A0A098EFC5_9ZZZZ